VVRWIVLFVLLAVAAALSSLTVVAGASFALAKGLVFVLLLAVALLVAAGFAVVRFARMTR
jgi:hypothetical protein